MKKYISILVTAIFTTTLQVFASPPPIPGAGQFGGRGGSSFFDFVTTLAAISVLIIIFSQIIVVWYIIRLLIRVYFLKTVQLGNRVRWFTSFFCLTYLLAIFTIILKTILVILGVELY